MKKFGFFILFVLMASALWTAEITVIVLDKDLGTPLEGVTLQAPDGKAVQTNADGKAVLTIPDDRPQTRISAKLIGYDSKKFWASPSTPQLNIEMAIGGIVDSKDLVVEQAKPKATDEQAGVSKVVSRDDIRKTAQIGVVEDVMSTIKTLPGVGYSGGFNSKPSIRGGSPSETRTVLDGVYVLDPYHWGGAYTIFNPNMVETAKLSNGIISASYGQVMSGLLEVTSLSSSSDEAQFDGGISTTGFDSWLRTPLGPKAGLIIGGKVTWMEVSFALANQLNAFAVVPYIRDAYFKAWWKPSNDVSLEANSFVGADGIGTSIDSGERDLTTKGTFNYQKITNFDSVRLKILLSNSALFGATVAWNWLHQDLHFLSTVNGTKPYSSTFLSAYSAFFPPGPAQTNFTLTDLTTDFTTKREWKTLQGKLFLDLEIATNQVLTFGVDSVFQLSSSNQKGTTWSDVLTAAAPPLNYEFRQVQIEVNPADNNSVVSGAYTLFNFNIDSGFLTGEAGLRVDHAALWNSNLTLNTQAAINPRLRLNLTPVRNLGIFDSFSIVAGSGLYSQVPDDANLLDKKYIKSEELSPNRSWFNVLGIDASLQDGWKFTVEGYYRTYFNRAYITGDFTQTPVGYTVHTDGTGYSAGIDVFLQRRTSRFWDGWLTYSFSETKYKNPTPRTSTMQTDINGNPLETEYYPSYHRFHTFNLISNWKPVDGFEILLKATFASGRPQAEVGSITAYPSTMGSQVIERYTRKTAYSDSLRTEFSLPIDLKVTWSGYFPGKVQWSYYVGVENLFANLYSPKTNKSFDPFYGDEIDGSDQADFTIGFPIPTVGFKISY